MFAVASVFFTATDAHAGLTWPPTWFDPHSIGTSNGTQCGLSGEPSCGDCQSVYGGYTGQCMWFNNFTFVDAPTIPEKSSLRTYKNMEYYPGQSVDWTMHNPWRAPGAAKIQSPCGVSGGNLGGCPSDDPNHHECYGGGWSFGVDALNVTWADTVTTTWKRGGLGSVAWGIIANHGGGYSYRLAKVPKAGKATLGEEDFVPLNFHGDSSYIQYGQDESTRFSIKAERTTIGTTPAGSQWTKNPIPACGGMDGGYTGELDQSHGCPTTGTQFPAPQGHPELVGFGETAVKPGFPLMNYNIWDDVEVPSDLEEGDYILSWRWDCEQTSQVWSNCADIKIVA